MYILHVNFLNIFYGGIVCDGIIVRWNGVIMCGCVAMIDGCLLQLEVGGGGGGGLGIVEG